MLVFCLVGHRLPVIFLVPTRFLGYLCVFSTCMVTMALGYNCCFGVQVTGAFKFFFGTKLPVLGCQFLVDIYYLVTSVGWFLIGAWLPMFWLVLGY